MWAARASGEERALECAGLIADRGGCAPFFLAERVTVGAPLQVPRYGIRPTFNTLRYNLTHFR